MTNKIIMVHTSMLEHHPDNPRKNIGDVTEHADSIRAKGILQNLTVVSSGKAMGVVEAPEKKMSLLKPYNNFEKIKAMSIDEMAEFIYFHCGCDTCVHYNDIENGGQCEIGECFTGSKQWLESEAE